MKEIYKFRIKEKRMFISGIVLLLILFVSWFFESYFAECIWRILTAGFAEQNGRNAKLNGRITFDY